MATWKDPGDLSFTPGSNSGKGYHSAQAAYTSGSFDGKTIAELANTFPFIIDGEDGEETVNLSFDHEVQGGSVEQNFTPQELAHVSTEAIMRCISLDDEFSQTDYTGAGIGGGKYIKIQFGGELVDSGYLPSALQNYRDHGDELGDIIMTVANWINAGRGNERNEYRHDPSEDPTILTDENVLYLKTVRGEAGYYTSIDKNYDIIDGLPGTDPDFDDHYTWSKKTVGRLGFGSLPSGLSGFELRMPYSPSGFVGKGARPSLGQYAKQAQKDGQFIRERTQKINRLRFALAKLKEENPEEFANQMSELSRMQKYADAENPEDVGDVDGDGDIDADDLAAAKQEEQRLRRNLGSVDNAAAVAELMAGKGAEFAAEFRAKEQCYLLSKIFNLATANIGRRMSYSTTQGGPKAHCVQGQPSTVVSALTYDPAYAAYYMIPPSKLSYLVPSIQLYSVLHQYYKDIDDVNSTTEDLGVPVDMKVPFFQHITEHGINEIMSGQFGSRGSQVGLDSFTWSYQGSNPATSRRDIKATLTLHAQNFEDLLKSHKVTLHDSEGNPFEHKWTYADLAIRRNRDHMQAPQVIYQQLKVVVGWSLPDAGHEGIDFTQDEINAIKNSRVTMFLTIIDHAFDIAEDGSVTFKIDYRAYIEGAFTSPEANILVSQQLLARQKERQEALANMREDMSSNNPTCTEDDLAELRRRITNSIQLDKAEAHVSLINGLELNKPESRVFTYSLTAGEMVRFLKQPSFDTSAYTPAALSGSAAPPSSTATSLQTANSGVAEHLKQAINFPSSVNFNSSSLPVNEMMSNVYSKPVSGEIRIHYFFLGDLINVALENIDKADVQASTPAQGPSGLNSAPPRQFGNMRLLLGPCEITDPYDQSKRMQINLADIPISVNYFMEWFLERITGKQEVKWFIVDFIKDITKNLVFRTLRSDDCFNGAHKQRSVFQNLFLVGADKDAAGSDPIEQLIGTSMSPSPSSQGSPTNDTGRLFVEEFIDDGAAVPFLAQDTEDIIRNSADMYHYVLMYAADPTPRHLRGNFAEDIKKGVFHFHMGTNKGIVKRIKFEKTDQPYLREARYFGQGYTGLSQLREPYKITLEMYGNSKVFPGQTIFVDPSGLGYSLGRPNEEGSKAHLLGLGGYHMIINVDHEIARGKFDTTAKAVWVFRGSPGGEITDTSDQSTPTRASAECQTWNTVQGVLAAPSGYVPPEGAESTSRFEEDPEPGGTP